MARKRHIADFGSVASIDSGTFENESNNPEVTNQSDAENTGNTSVMPSPTEAEADNASVAVDEPATKEKKQDSKETMNTAPPDSHLIEVDQDAELENNTESVDVIDDILNNSKGKSTRVQRGLYLDKDIDKVLTNLFKKGGKGSKSDILNSVLRKEFKNKGLL